MGRRQTPLQAEENGSWYADVTVARAGDQYKFLLTTAQGELKRIDPYAREVTNSVGNAIVHDPSFDWKGDDFRLASWNEIVVYELHVGTFNEKDDDISGKFAAVSARLGHLSKLGVNAVQIMPIAQFAENGRGVTTPPISFRLRPTMEAFGVQAVCQACPRAWHCGDPGRRLQPLGPERPRSLAVRRLVRERSRGIYFYNDERAHTPWGDTRPDYGRGEVRQYILDNATMWLEEYRVDGLRFDGHGLHSNPDGPGSADLPDGWSLLQAINSLVAQKLPGRITIARTCRTTNGSPMTLGPAAPGSARNGMPTSSTYPPGGDHSPG